MRLKDVKLLWGRSGNRCAFPGCKIELTSSGSSQAIGEIAHIIAKSKDGPRGDEELIIDKRDDYENLILLCPTHHAIIDTEIDKYSVFELKQIKKSHEIWVSESLEKWELNVEKIDNAEFLEKRNKFLEEFTDKNIWIIFTLTPIDISHDILDPLDDDVINIFNKTRLPHCVSVYDDILRRKTHPNENGLINEDLENLKMGVGHRLEVFRNGHCEFDVCFESSILQITESFMQKHPEENQNIRIIRFTDLIRCFEIQIKTLFEFWKSFLPFNDMLIKCIFTNTVLTKMYSRESYDGDTLGHLLESSSLDYENVVNKEDNHLLISEVIIKRFVNYYGLVLNSLYDETGNLNRPDLLY